MSLVWYQHQFAVHTEDVNATFPNLSDCCFVFFNYLVQNMVYVLVSWQNRTQIFQPFFVTQTWPIPRPQEEPITCVVTEWNSMTPLGIGKRDV